MTEPNRGFSDEVKKDLEKSGLSPEDAAKVGWYELSRYAHPKRHLKELLGFANYQGHDLIKVTSAILVIPNPRADLARVRLYPPINGVRYLQPANLSPQPYIPETVWDIREKTHKPVVITEGEKKCLLLIKEGFNAIGLPGVWCFKNSKTDQNDLLADLREFNWRGRTVFITFDSDSIFNQSVRRAEIELAIKLWQRGGKVFVVRLPQSRHDEKWGVDDFIVDRGVGEFRELVKKAAPLYKAWPSEYAEEVLAVISRLGLQPERLSLLIELMAKFWKFGKKTTFGLLHAQKKKAEGSSPRWSEDTEKAARELLLDPDLINRLLKDISKIYIGREKEKILLKLLLVGRKIANNTEGTGIIIQGASSVGKSALVKSIVLTCDEDDVLEFTRMSANYLLYTDKSLARRVLIVFEMPGIEDAAMTIRTGLSESVLKIGTVEKNQTGQLQARENSIDATGMVLISTTTRTKIDFQLGTRVIAISIDHDPDLARKAYGLMASKATGGLEEPDFKVWQTVDALLQSKKVMIPFAPRLAELFPTDQERYMRDFQKVVFLIEASALLYQFQRSRDAQGSILATRQDYDLVHSLQSVIFEAVYDHKIETFLQAVDK
jgi:hypothetical protein